MASAVAQVVGHVQDDQRGDSQRQDRRRQHQVARQIRRIEHQQDRFGLGRVRPFAGENVVGHLFVFRARRHAVDSRQVDDADCAAIRQLGYARTLFHGYAGEVGYLLAQARETIE